MGNKKAATSIASPATSKVPHQNDVAITSIIPNDRSTVKEESTESDYLSDEEFKKRYGLKLPNLNGGENSTDSQTFGNGRTGGTEQERFSVDEDESDVAEQPMQKTGQKGSRETAAERAQRARETLIDSLEKLNDGQKYLDAKNAEADTE